MARGEHAIKAIKIFKLLTDRNHFGVTVEELVQLFRISRRSAYRYLEFIELAGVELSKSRIDGKMHFKVDNRK